MGSNPTATTRPDPHRRRPRAVPRRAALAVAGVAALALAGCVSTPPPPAPTIVKVALSAAPDANLGPGGQPAPLQVHLFWLRAAAGVQQADFFALTETPEATLGADLAAHETVTVRPGQSVSVSHRATQGESALGVVAAYRRIDQVAWKSVVSFAPNRTTGLTVTLGAMGVSVGTGGPVASAAATRP